MTIKTGFYNTEILSTFQQKQLMRDAIMLAFNVKVQSKYSERNDWRDVEPSVSIKEALNTCDSLKMINRTIQYLSNDDTHQGELSLITTSWKKQGWLLLYCFVTIPNLEILANKYKLTMY